MDVAKGDRPSEASGNAVDRNLADGTHFSALSSGASLPRSASADVLAGRTRGRAANAGRVARRM